MNDFNVLFLKAHSKKSLHLSISITACFSVPFASFSSTKPLVTLMDQHEQLVDPCREAPDKGKVFL